MAGTGDKHRTVASRGPVRTRRWAPALLVRVGAIALMTFTLGIPGASAATPSTASSSASGPLVSDAFERVSSGWGSADVGGRYTLSGPADSFKVKRTRGTMNVGRAGAVRSAYLPSVAARDIDVTVRVSTDKLVSGGYQFAYLLLRRTNAGQAYVAKLQIASDRRVYLQLSRINGTETALTAPTLVPHATHRRGSYIRIRAQATGAAPTTLRARAWEAGDTEPAKWTVARTDRDPALQKSRGVGVRGYISNEAKNAPVTFAFDGLRVVATAPPAPTATRPPASCAQPFAKPTRPYDAGITKVFQCADPVRRRTIDVRSHGATPDDSRNDDAPAIQRAINAAAAGDEVYLPAGKYHVKSGPIVLKSGVSVRGRSRDSVVLTTMFPSHVNTVMHLRSGGSNLTVSDFTVRRGSGTYHIAVRLGSGQWNTNNSTVALVTRVAVMRLRIEGHQRWGIALENTQHVLVRNNIIRYATALGGGGMGYGVNLMFDRTSQNWITSNQVGPTIRHAYVVSYRVHHNLFENNTATGTTQDAFDIHGEDEYSNEMRRNTVAACLRTDPQTRAKTYPAGFGVGEVPVATSGTGAAAHDVSGPHNWLHHNTVTGCYAGVRINTTHRTYVEDNVLQRNEYGLRVGDLRGSNHSRILRNNVRLNITGIALGAADDTIVSGNVSTGNSSRGLSVLAVVDRYTITHNDFRANGAPVSVLSKKGRYAHNLQ
jgi:nitrous oxidase accessory protein NosD